MWKALPASAGERISMSSLLPTILLIGGFLLAVFALRFVERRHWH